MKSLSLAGLVLVLFLAGIFVYVVEDVPAFGNAKSPANRYIALFSIDAENMVASLDAGVVPAEIKSRTEALGFTKENYFPTMEEGNYVIERNEEDEGWDILIHEGEIFFTEPLKYYHVKEEADGKLTIYRYNWPIRVLEKTEEETGTMNAVTSGLADYRGYDTMFEETVIFSGAVSVVLLLRKRGRL
jgi:hypothetical protein